MSEVNVGVYLIYIVVATNEMNQLIVQVTLANGAIVSGAKCCMRHDFRKYGVLFFHL